MNNNRNLIIEGGTIFFWREDLCHNCKNMALNEIELEHLDIKIEDIPEGVDLIFIDGEEIWQQKILDKKHRLKWLQSTNYAWF